MPHYLDSGAGIPDQYLGNWAQCNLVAGIRGFRAQFGYFRFRALAPFADILRGAGAAGHPVHLVLGSNNGSLVAADVQRTLRIVDGTSASLTVVAFAGAEFHPKTIHLVRADESTAAVVGSSNFTENGLGLNVEAAIVLDTREGDGTALVEQIGQAVERWHRLWHPGVFPIETDADIQALADAGVINLPQPPKLRQTQGRLRIRSGVLGRRSRAWIAVGGGRGPVIPALIAPPLPVRLPPPPRPTTTRPSAGGGAVRKGREAAIVAQWCKRLPSSDAQQVKPGTNPTGKLRLTESGFEINHQTWFRTRFFAGLRWSVEARRDHPYEIAVVPFDIKVRGRSWGRRALTIDHAPHRVAAQSNVPTVLAWGPDLMRELTGTNHTGDWVVLARDARGNFGLTIQSRKPHWAP